MKRWMIRLVVILVVVILLSMWGSMVLAALWGWFVVPTFGIVPLSWTQAWGLNLVVAFMVYHPSPRNPDADFVVEMVYQVISMVWCSIIVLAIGWALHGAAF